MAENKKSFLLYADIIYTVSKLSLSRRGKLFTMILDYVNDKNPTTNDIQVDLVFEPIKRNLKRDLEKYTQYVEKQKVNGAKGGRPKSNKKTQKTQAFILKPKKGDNDNVNDNDNVYKYIKEKEKEKIELFEMQNKKSFPNYEMFIENFNCKVIEEGLVWDSDVLLARLKRLNANWDKSPKKEKAISLAQKMKNDYGIK